MLRLQAAKLPATVLAYMPRLRNRTSAQSAKVMRSLSSKAALREWINAAVRQAFPFLGSDAAVVRPASDVLLQWILVHGSALIFLSETSAERFLGRY